MTKHADSSMVKQRYVQQGDIRLSVYERGSASNPTVILLHGYPDNADVWNATADELAHHFHVVSYDIRGAGQSSAPDNIEAFAFEHLSADLLAVIDAVSPDAPVHLVGHDWGALQGWEALLSGALAGRVASYSTAAPPLDHLGHWFREKLAKPTLTNLAKMLGRIAGSSYMLMIQLPWLPELSWRLGLGQMWPHLVSQLEGVKVPGHPGQTTDAVNSLGLYRANLLPPLLHPQTRHTDVPVHLLVMKRDPFIPAALFEGLQTVASNLRRSEFSAGHWGLLSQPEQLASRISDFVSSIKEI